MSEEKIERVSRLYDAFNRRDLDAFLELAHEDVVVESRLAAIEGGYRGHDGTRRWWANLNDVFPDFTVEVDELRDLGDITLARLTARAHGAESNAPLVEVLWHPIRWRDGKVIWWRLFSTEAEALEAAGLSG